VTVGALIGHGLAMGAGVTHLTIWVVIVGGHIFENLLDVTRETRNIAMLSGQRKIGLSIVVELNQREASRIVAV
jgi:hypothetical protein